MPERLEILTRLLQDHVSARRVLANLEREVDRVAQFQTPDWAAIADALDFFRSYMGTLHYPIEDMIYSALKRAAPSPAADNEKVAREHDEAGVLLSQLADVTAELTADTDGVRAAFCRIARGLIAFERHHLRREESQFFIAAGEHLAPEDWRRISTTAKGLEADMWAANTGAKTQQVRPIAEAAAERILKARTRAAARTTV